MGEGPKLRDVIHGRPLMTQRTNKNVLFRFLDMKLEYLNWLDLFIYTKIVVIFTITQLKTRMSTPTMVDINSNLHTQLICNIDNIVGPRYSRLGLFANKKKQGEKSENCIFPWSIYQYYSYSSRPGVHNSNLMARQKNFWECTGAKIDIFYPFKGCFCQINRVNLQNFLLCGPN